MYHPAPGDQISHDHYLDVVIKNWGQANAYTFSIFSPATVIFKAQDTTIQEYVQQTGSVDTKARQHGGSGHQDSARLGD